MSAEEEVILNLVNTECSCTESGECTCDEYNCMCECECENCTIEIHGGCGCGGNCMCGMQEEE